MKLRYILVIQILNLAFVQGCSSSSGPMTFPTYKVSGQVNYGGKPAENVQVYLFPLAAPTIPDIPSNPRATTNKNGLFEISTYSENDGAPAGKYQILMIWPDDKSTNEQKQDKLFGWYGPGYSQLEIQVKDGRNNIPPINVPLITREPGQINGVPGRN